MTLEYRANFQVIMLPSCPRKELFASFPAHHRERQMLLVLPNCCPRFYHFGDDLENQLRLPVHRRRKAQGVFSNRPRFKFTSGMRQITYTLSLSFSSCKMAIISPSRRFLRGLNEVEKYVKTSDTVSNS